MTMMKVNLVNQMKRMNRYFIKLFFLSAVICFKNVNAKTHPYIISLDPCSSKILLLLSNISNHFSHS